MDLFGGLVANIARNKVLQQAEFHAAPKRDIRKEQETETSSESRVTHTEPSDPEPTPEEAACWIDTLDMIQSKLKPDSFAIVAMKLEGYSTPEIAGELGVARQTISNKVRHIEGRLRCILNQERRAGRERELSDNRISDESQRKSHRTPSVSG